MRPRPQVPFQNYPNQLKISRTVLLYTAKKDFSTGVNKFTAVYASSSVRDCRLASVHPYCLWYTRTHTWRHKVLDAHLWPVWGVPPTMLSSLRQSQNPPGHSIPPMADGCWAALGTRPGRGAAPACRVAGGAPCCILR